MEDTSKNIGLIDQFIENEKRSRIWTILSVVIFCLLGSVVWFLAVKVQKQKKELENAYAKLDELAGQYKVKYETTLLKKDSTDKAHETTKVLFKETMNSLTDNNTEFTSERIRQVYKNVFHDQRNDYPDSLVKSILDSKISLPSRNKDITIDLMYMPGQSDLMNKIYKQLNDPGILQGRKIIVNKPEPVQKVSFNNSVRYFSEPDEAVANRIIEYLNEKNGKDIKNKFVANKIDIKEEPHHIEIWIGEYKFSKLNFPKIKFQVN